jgi:hypothetical protein
MKKSIITSAALFFLLSLSTIEVRAQYIIGASLIQEVGGTVQLVTATALDAAAYEYYDAAVAGSIYLDGLSESNLIAVNSNAGGSYSETYVVVSSIQDRDFFDIGDHFIVCYLNIYPPPVDLWWDPYGFSLLAEENYPGEITFFGCNCPVIIPRFEYVFSTLVGLHSQCFRVPTLTGNSTVTRGQTGTYTLANFCLISSVSNWKFTDQAGRQSSRSDGSPNADYWTGPMVTGGTVSVTVNQGGTAYDLSTNVTVTRRQSGFFFNAAQPQQVQNGAQCPGAEILQLPEPPVPNGDLGLSCLVQDTSNLQLLTVDSGPNTGYQYVGSINNATLFFFNVSPSADNPSSTFYQRQYGNYNPATGTGFISGAQLRTNIYDHEANPVKNSHYSFYKEAQDSPDLNIGRAIETVVQPPGTTPFNMLQAIENVSATRRQTISNATSLEPCGSGLVNFDNNCTLNGPINFPPYAPRQ